MTATDASSDTKEKGQGLIPSPLPSAYQNVLVLCAFLGLGFLLGLLVL